MPRLLLPLAALLLFGTAPIQAHMAAHPPAAEQDHGDHDDDHHHDHDDHHDHDHDHHVAELDGLRAIHAWSRATDGRNALVFVELKNSGESAITLLGGQTDIAESVTLVGFQLQNGEPAYVPLPQMPIPAGGEVVLAPNGLALELSGLSRPLLRGETFTVEFTFDIGHLDVVVEVEAENAHQHSHAGHAH